jgi:hypothetical protein
MQAATMVIPTASPTHCASDDLAMFSITTTRSDASPVLSEVEGRTARAVFQERRP